VVFSSPTKFILILLVILAWNQGTKLDECSVYGSITSSSFLSQEITLNVTKFKLSVEPDVKITSFEFHILKKLAIFFLDSFNIIPT
jgi:hypothetical protein